LRLIAKRAKEQLSLSVCPKKAKLQRDFRNFKKDSFNILGESLFFYGKNWKRARWMHICVAGKKEQFSLNQEVPNQAYLMV